MSNRNLIIGIGFLVIIILGGVWLYNWVLGETEAASGPISAPTLELDATLTEPQAAIPTVATSEPTLVAGTVEDQAEAISQGGGVVVFKILQDDSRVQFNIFEELRGEPTDVIGVSNQIAGEVAVDLSDLSFTQVGMIQINARTLQTDSDRRDQAIRNRILNTDQYEFITFTPTEVSGLSGEAEQGETINFQIVGELTIREITQQAVFDVTAYLESDNRIVGNAEAVINRSDYNLIIPNVPFVANVGEEVVLEIDFVLVV